MTRSNFPAILPRAIGLSLAVLVLAACGLDSGGTTAGTAAAAPVGAAAAHTLIVHEGPHCGCCGLWRQHMEQAGFTVEVRQTQQLGMTKAALDVPANLTSCHTAEIGGYFIEGHVPAQDVRRLLAERPAARGLTVPGMPMGSPGMEGRGGQVQPYEVLLVGQDGSTTVYARYSDRASACSSIDLAEGDAT